ncbi:alpha-ribazole phosphatase [Flavihumibacter sp. UBA7668]|uniref:alpha-ribazole phosphatase n=1 Tax=Flavihumibacter sp. UBA7668 TaxID=1946542 RepID=UPI0025C32229|nr:alpha-ribazole phosphatase [Flavihumibacter sp. UBA7668]
MEIYLIRHTRPAIEKGICYGQADLDIVESFYEEAAIIRAVIPAKIHRVYSSPLQRCRKLAEHLFESPIEFHNDLMEINCGEWELRHWDTIPKEEVQPWMDNFVQVRIPGGESYEDLYTRTTQRFEQIRSSVLENAKPIAIVAHGGVIRSILSHLTGTPMRDSFQRFPLFYGCVARVKADTGNHEILLNIEQEKEQHRPKT